jgi:endo-1,4-beta-xylanase
LDVAVNRDNDKQIAYTNELKKLQYERYMTVASVMASLQEKQQYGITMWGVGDTDSYLYSNPDWPLPFDENYQRKKAYDGLIDGFK